MDQNDKNNKNRRGNRNLLGVVKLVAWALVLTLVFYCTSSYMGSAGKQASNINIKYSDFIAMMEDKQVEDVTVDLSEGLLYIVPKDGYVYTAENGTAYTKSTDQDGKAVYAFTDADGKEHTAALKLFTVKMESNDTLVERMHEAGKTDYDTKYEPQMSPLLLFAINFILPFVFIMLHVLPRHADHGEKRRHGRYGRDRRRRQGQRQGLHGKADRRHLCRMWPVRTRPRNP